MKNTKVMGFLVIMIFSVGLLFSIENHSSSNTIDDSHNIVDNHIIVLETGSLVTGGISYTITTTDLGDTIKSKNYGVDLIGEKTEGKFIALNLTINNETQDHGYLNFVSFQLADQKQRHYWPISIASCGQKYPVSRLESDSLMMDLNPDIPCRVLIIYEVSKDSQQPYTLDFYRQGLFN